jgi:hypothetical protein
VGHPVSKSRDITVALLLLILELLDPPNDDATGS